MSDATRAAVAPCVEVGNLGPWRRRAPALMLFLLSPAIGELLSSSSPPAEFFSPVGFIMMAVLYGGGAILCRELAHRWGKGLLSLLLLGAAYGIVEEGLLVKSFFNPNWMDMGGLGSYGRWGGVNWVWTVNLILYHAVISIATPVLLVGLVFPDRADQPWVSMRWMRVLAGLLTADVLVGLLFMGDGPGGPAYRPPVVPYLLAAIVTVVLAWCAYRIPARPRGEANAARHRRRFSIAYFVLGFLMVAGYFIVPDATRRGGAAPIVTVLVTVGYLGILALAVAWVARRGGGWPPHHQWALMAGLLAPFILLAPCFEYKVIPRTDDTRGMTWVGVFFALFLLWIRARVARSKPRPT